MDCVRNLKQFLQLFIFPASAMFFKHGCWVLKRVTERHVVRREVFVLRGCGCGLGIDFGAATEFGFLSFEAGLPIFFL